MHLSYCARVHCLCWLLPLSAAWTHAVVGRQQLGWARVLAALPAFLILAVAPLFFHHETEPVALMSTAYLSERLPLTKLLAFCLGRGPLAEHGQQLTLWQFTALMLCPCVIRHENPGSKLTPATPRNLLTALGTKCLTIGILVMLPSYLSCRAVQHLAAAIGMYCATSGTLDFFMLMCQNLGLNLAMPFKQPFLSASLSEFWGFRWNVPQAQLLRALVYAPIVEGRLIQAQPKQSLHQQHQQHQHQQRQQHGCAGDAMAAADPAQARKQQGAGEQAACASEMGTPRRGGNACVRAVAVMATFLFSGLEHVLFIWYVTRKLHWPWLSFFAVHGVLIIVLEHLLPMAWAWARATSATEPQPARSLQPHSRAQQGNILCLPRPVRVLLTMALLHVTAIMWFYEPFLDPVLLGRIAQSFRETKACLTSFLS